MATEFLMPKLGLTMEEGTILEWLIADGAAVEVGAAILRIETDKTETDVEAATAGRLHVVGRVGDTFACGERIGWLLAPGEEAPAGGAPVTDAAAAPIAPTTPSSAPTAAVAVAASVVGGRVMASPLAKRLATERGLDLRTVRGTGPEGRIVAADLDDVVVATVTQRPAPAAASSSPAGTWPATAAARQLADLLGVDISRVALDPVDGYVTRESVAHHVRGLLASAAGTPAATTAPAVAAPSPSLAPATQIPSSTVRLSGMRGTIAKRMRESLTQMAQLTLFMDADLDAVVADRTQRATQGGAPSYTDYVIAAAARALVQHPIANSQITDDGVALLPVVHVGMAVALDGGLIVPVITNTASRNLASLSAESSRLAAAARAGSLQLTDLEGGTFSVSTLGMFGVDGFTPVINPPNTCILGVGRLRDDLVLTGAGDVATRKRITLSLTWDHRAFDGAPAAAFCKSIVELLDNPAALDAPTS
jgi:pyruvate dehydrogenase E2 component (dihydrolipoamide acetyltransferase)